MSAHHDHADADSARETIRWCPRCERGAGDADRCPACEGATVPRAVDPLDVVPDGFVRDWNAESDATVTTIADALRVAEAAPSTTPASELSTKLRWESDARVCDECAAAVPDPLPAPADIAVRAAPRDAAPEPVCPDCGSWRLADGFSGEIECLSCGWLGEEAIDARAFTDGGQATLGEVTGE